MQCMSCNSEIDPKWKFAIDKNACPFCGEVILPEDLKQSFSSLREILDSLRENYLDQLDDWMLSNYKYIRTDGPKMGDFTPKAQVVYKEILKSSSQEVEEDESVVSRQDPETTAKFFKNADAVKSVGRSQELKKMVEEIKSKQGPTSAKKIITQQDLEDVGDLDETYSSMSEDPYEEDIPPQVLAMAGMPTKKDPTYNMKDAMKLQQMHQKTMESRRAVANGTGGKGSFSRG